MLGNVNDQLEVMLDARVLCTSPSLLTQIIFVHICIAVFAVASSGETKMLPRPQSVKAGGNSRRRKTAEGEESR